MARRKRHEKKRGLSHELHKAASTVTRRKARGFLHKHISFLRKKGE